MDEMLLSNSHRNFCARVRAAEAVVRSGPLRSVLIACAMLCATTMEAAMAENATFADDPVGATPKGWTTTMTGKGAPRWTVETDPTWPSPIVKQSGTAAFPLLLKNGTTLKDGFVETRFKPVAGHRDQAGGIVWRAKDANNYYVVRANALEDNVVLYKTVDGKRSPLDIVGRSGGYGVNRPVPSGQWHSLRVEFTGSRFKVVFNGTPAFEVEDSTFPDAGMIGLWTKADSVTAFDAISYGALP
jgi:hypothetical protein